MEKPTIAILLSSFNGEKYITQQIESLIDQTYRQWELYIRDDGSTDTTPDIIQALTKSDKRIHLMRDSILHRGVKESFLWLLSHVSATYSYYMFCDQDDVWLPNKIEVSCRALQNAERPGLPVLVCTDLRIVDKNLNTLHNSMWEKNHSSKIIEHPENIQIAPLYTGCTMLFNKAAAQAILKLPPISYIIHDQLVALTVFKEKGKIIPLPIQTILYRQHSNNVVGTYAGKNQLWHKLKKLSVVFRENRSYYNIVHSFLGTGRIQFIKMKIKHLLNY